MKNLFKRVTSFITALAMTMTLTGGVQLVSFAEEEAIETVLQDSITISTDEYELSDDELLLGYFENKLYGIDGGISTFAIANSASLKGNYRTIYDTVYAAAKQIAAGERASTAVNIPILSWKYSDFNTTDFDTAADALDLEFDAMFSEIYGYLLRDNPYEFYWHKKKISTNEYSVKGDGTNITIEGLIIYLDVGSDYAVSTAYTVDTAKTSSASSAAAKAKAIVAENTGKTELERLTAYKEAICELVSYDDNAAANINNTSYGVAPWQVIHVFDNDSETNVVCEGYAKAFQYLCDLDEGSLTCYSVSGTMAGGTGSGPHMWNIVTLGGNNYLVDVTNCDGDSNSMSIGYPDKLFLKGMTYDSENDYYYKTINGQNIIFAYDSNMASLFGTDILTLSTTDYSEAQKTITSITIQAFPTKTEYYITEAFDPTGLVIRVNYSDNSHEDVTYSDENKDAFTFDKTTLVKEDTAVTVTYSGKTASETVPVTVTNVVTIDISELELGVPSENTGWEWDGNILTLSDGFEFIIKGENNDVVEVKNYGTISDGTFNKHVRNYGTISGGTFNDGVTNNDGATISGGEFNAVVSNSSGATISGGEFNAGGLAEFENRGTISGGKFFDSRVVNYEGGEITDGQFDNILNMGTITGGTFIVLVTNDEGGKITGGNFNEVENCEGATIEITNGSVKIEACTMDNGTVTVGDTTHNHDMVATYTENPDDATKHIKATACENCPINYVGSENESESHSVTVFTAAGNVITAKCVCDKEFGTFTLEAPADLAYNGEAKAATVTVAGEVGGEATPTVEYYIGDGKLDAAPTNRGTYTAKITVDDATAELEFTIGAKDISVATVTVTPLEYTGAAQSAGIVLKDGDYTLVKDTDYSITGDASATNAGSYDVIITGMNNYQGSLEETWTITKASPNIGTVTVVGNAIYDTTKPSEIKLTHSNTEIAGTFTIDENITLTANQNVTINWTFTPDSANYKTKTGSFTAQVIADTINSIAVKTNPAKTEYIATENFDPTGLALTVTYLSGNTADVTYSEENKGKFEFEPATIAADTEFVTIKYGEQEKTIKVTVTNVVTVDISKLSTLENSSGIGWEWNGNKLTLSLSDGFEFIIKGKNNDAFVDNHGTIISGTFNYGVDNYGTITDGTFNNTVGNYGTITGGTFSYKVMNKSGGTITGGTFNKVNNQSGGTISGGTFNDTVDNIGTITGGTFAEVGNFGTIEITNGSVKIDKCVEDKGTVTVGGNTHEHNGNNVTYSEYDYNWHTKVTVCEDCPINLETKTIEEHYPAVSTASGNAITLECACGEDLGTITIEAPLSLEYTGRAKEATVTADTHHFVDPPAEYYKGNEKLEAAPKDVGTYTAKVTYMDATAEVEFTIVKVVPEVEVTASTNGTLFTSSTTDDVTLTATATNPVSGTAVAGTIAFDGAIEFKVGTNDYPVIFTPTDTNYDPVKKTVSLPVVEDTLTGIAVAGTPAKTEYVEGDKFDPTGLTVTATYDSGKTKVIEHELLTISPVTLAKGNTSVTVSYNGKTAEKPVDGIIVRGKLAADKFKFTAPAANSEGKIVYDKTAKSATVEVNNGITGVGAITVNYYKDNTKLDGAPTNAGTYKVVIDVALGDEYVAATNLSDASWTFTIEKATPSIKPSVTAPDKIYDTTPVSNIVIDSGIDVEGTIKLDNVTKLSDEVSSYPVIFIPNDTDNYNTVNGTVGITVVKDVITNIEVTTQPTKTEYTYGEEFDPKGLVITATYESGNKVDITYTADNKNEFSFTPDELTVDTTEVTVTCAGNNEITDTIKVKVNKATPEYDAPTNLKANYGDSLADVELPDGWRWNDKSDTSIGDAGINKFPATYSKGTNYEDVTTELAVVVSPKTISIAGVAVKNKDYDGKTDATVGAVTFNGIINADAVDYTATGTFADKNAGENKSVTVKVTITNKNYTLDSDTYTATATINKVDPEVTIPQTASAITDQPLSKAKLPDGWTWDEPRTIPVDGQSYGITYTPDDTTNYNTITTQVTVTVSDCTHPETTVNIKDATCTVNGLKTTICKICDETTGTEVIPAAHNWNNDYTVDAEATCIKDGQKSIHCAECNEIKPDSTVAIPSGHNWNDDYTIDTEATCTTDGSKSIHCKNCTEIMPDSEVKIPAEHKWNEGYTSDNTKHWIGCEKCDETKDEGNHSYGYTAHSKQYCSVCRNSYAIADERPTSTPGAGTIHSIHTAPKPTEPQIKDENGKTGWDVISDEVTLAQDGDTVVVDMNGTTKLPKSILADIAGRNIDIVLDMGNGISWTINGETVTNPKAVDMRVSKNVKRIPVDVIDNVTGDNFNMEISLAHNGKFGFEAMLTISLGRKHNDSYANLYYYNPSDKAMEFIDSDLIANGNAQLVFNHASDYVIVIDEEALGDDVSSAAGVTAESEAMDTETVSVVFALPLVLAAGFVIRKKLCR